MPIIANVMVAESAVTVVENVKIALNRYTIQANILMVRRITIARTLSIFICVTMRTSMRPKCCT